MSLQNIVFVFFTVVISVIAGSFFGYYIRQVIAKRRACTLEAKLEKNVLISNRAKNSNTNFQKILMLVGIVFILSCAILTFHRFKQGRLNQDEKE